jgi:hypothetical protein
MPEHNREPYFVVSSTSPPGLARRFSCLADAGHFARETARRSRLRLLLVKYVPNDPVCVCEILQEFDGTLPWSFGHAKALSHRGHMVMLNGPESMSGKPPPTVACSV